MTGHVALNEPNADKTWFVISDPLQRVRSLANPMAVQIGTGGGTMSDYTPATFWTQEDWRGGGGKDPDVDSGGYLWGTIDSRFSGKLSPPPHTGLWADSVTTIQPGESYTFPFIADASGGVLIFIRSQSELSVEIQSVGGAVLESGLRVAPAVKSMAPELVPVRYTPSVTTPGVTYNLVVTAAGNATATIPLHGGNPQTMSMKNVYGDVIAGAVVSGKFYFVNNAGAVWTETSNGVSTLVDTGKTTTGAASFNGTFILAHGPNTDITVVYPNGSTSTVSGVKAQAIVSWMGYVYVGAGNTVKYSTDALDWINVTIGPSGELINNLVGLGDSVLVCTDYAIWRLAPGDFVIGVTRWAGGNDAPVVRNWQGAAFISDGVVLNKHSAGPIQPIFHRGDSLPSALSKKIVGIDASNRDLFMAVNGAGGGAVLSFTGEGWCSLFTAHGQQISSLTYDTLLDKLSIWIEGGYRYEIDPNTGSASPELSAGYMYAPYGQITTGWYGGGLKVLDKDWVSVTVVGQSIDVNNWIDVYYRAGNPDSNYILDESSEVITDESMDPMYTNADQYIYIGRVTESGQELPFDVHRRGTSAEISLTYVLGGKGGLSAPRVGATSLKYVASVVDYYRWSLPILVMDHAEQPDGTLSAMTRDEVVTKLEGFASNGLPVILTDIDGSQYTVRVQGANERVIKYELLPDGPRVQSVWQLTLLETE
jgi:hypothetical protein